MVRAMTTQDAQFDVMLRGFTKYIAKRYLTMGPLEWLGRQTVADLLYEASGRKVIPGKLYRADLKRTMESLV